MKFKDQGLGHTAQSEELHSDTGCSSLMGKHRENCNSLHTTYRGPYTLNEIQLKGGVGNKS